MIEYALIMGESYTITEFALRTIHELQAAIEDLRANAKGYVKKLTTIFNDMKDAAKDPAAPVTDLMRIFAVSAGASNNDQAIRAKIRAALIHSSYYDNYMGRLAYATRALDAANNIITNGLPPITHPFVFPSSSAFNQQSDRRQTPPAE